MPVMFVEGKPLLVNGKVAMHEDCCCRESVFCANCIDNKAAPEYLVLIEGIVGGDLQDGAYVVTPSSPCNYILFGWNISGGANLVLQITDGRIDVYGTGGPHFTKTDSDNDCLNWNELDIPLTDSSNGHGSDCSLATCKITALF